MGKVIVTGSINMDIVASAARQPKPGETVIGSELHFYPGGKGANQAVAAARAGAETILLGNVGDDQYATELMSFLADAGVDTSAVHAIADEPSGVALVVVDAHGENSIVVVPGANGRLVSGDVERVTMKRGDVLVAQLEIPMDPVVVALARARARGATTMLNPAPVQELARELGNLVDVLVLNETELSALASTTITLQSSVDDVRSAVSRLGRDANRFTVVTLGARGSITFVGDRAIEVPGCRVEAVDTTGAGDCFVGTLAARLAVGDALEEGLELANVAASMSVERPGAGPSMPSLSQVLDRLGI